MYKKRFLTRLLSLLGALGISFYSLAAPLSEQEFTIQDSGEIQLNVVDRPLADILETLQYTHQTRFVVNNELAEERVSLNITTDDWDELTRQVLLGFNWIQQDAAQSTQNIFILERTDAVRQRNVANDEVADEDPLDEIALDAEDSLFTVGRTITDTDITIPGQLAAYPEHVVQAIALDMATIQHLAPGDVITLNLPSGQQHVTFIESDSVDENGTTSWIGYIGDEDAHYDVIITSGEDGLFAHINTPNGLQTIESINGQQWWVDVANSGLDNPDQINDTFSLPTTPSIDTTASLITTAPLIADQGNMSRSKARSAINKWSKRVKKWKNQLKRTNNSSKINQLKRKIRVAKNKIRALRGSSNRAQSTATRIDILAAYTSGVSTTRVTQLIKLANNAFSNSGVAIRLRIVKMLNVSYTISNDNNIALQDLTYSKKELGDINSLRDQYKADLVTLVRPFRYPAQDSCGIAWLGGANGSNFHPITGFSVVSDGANNGYYCSDYTLAHEVGHNLGSAHDRPHAGAAGAYSYSYGFGSSGKAGSIMSYINPEVGRFSSPSYKCNTIICGDSDANNVMSLNRTRKVIANYK